MMMWILIQLENPTKRIQKFQPKRDYVIMNLRCISRGLTKDV
jgi:hypothetical protein